MGNSTISIQAIIDSVSTIGDLNPVLVSTGGWSNEPALTIANDTIQEMFSGRFPWKFNRAKYPPFFMNSRQQDYAALYVRDVGWLENAFRIQLNTTVIPHPAWALECVRDVNLSRVMAGWPTRIAWYPNDQLEQQPWPGPHKVYLDPYGRDVTPDNPPTNIYDRFGNILILTQWGITGFKWPEAPQWTDPDNPEPANWPVGQQILDGSCIWTVADPKAQGMRMFPPAPDSSGATWLIRVFYQKSAPTYHDLQETIEPIPDEYSKWFRDGFIAYCHRYSATPSVKARFQEMRQNWLQGIDVYFKQGAQEEEGRGFFPDKGILSPEWYTDPGPGNPYWRQWGGS